MLTSGLTGVRDWGRKSANVAKYNETQTLTHYLVCEHFCLSYSQIFNCITMKQTNPMIPHCFTTTSLFSLFYWRKFVCFGFLNTSLGVTVSPSRCMQQLFQLSCSNKAWRGNQRHMQLSGIIQKCMNSPIWCHVGCSDPAKEQLIVFSRGSGTAGRCSANTQPARRPPHTDTNSNILHVGDVLYFCILLISVFLW